MMHRIVHHLFYSDSFFSILETRLLMSSTPDFNWSTFGSMSFWKLDTSVLTSSTSSPIFDVSCFARSTEFLMLVTSSLICLLADLIVPELSVKEDCKSLPDFEAFNTASVAPPIVPTTNPTKIFFNFITVHILFYCLPYREKFKHLNFL